MYTTPVNSQMDDVDGVFSAIHRFQVKSSLGSDGPCSKLPKLTGNVSGVLLASLFQQSLDTGSIPAAWKWANLIPIHKSCNCKSVPNYRPISLMSMPCKRLEHIVYSLVLKHFASNNIPSNQHGFQRDLSCESQLFELVTDSHTSIHSSPQTDTAFINFSKVLDWVPTLVLQEITVS